MCKQDCGSHKKKDFGLYGERRATLLQMLKDRNPTAAPGVVLFIADFEREKVRFRQESSFYYMTGIEEPATMLMLDQESGTSTLYIPDFGKERAKWVQSEVDIHAGPLLGIDTIAYAGNPCKGYQCHPFFTGDEYTHVLKKLQDCLTQKRPIRSEEHTSELQSQR